MVRLENVSRVYRGGQRGAADGLRALDDVSLQIDRGEFVVVRGPSGSGKTTLLMIVGGMLRPSAGRVFVDGADLTAMNPTGRARFRAGAIGFVFQMFHLVPYLNVIENVLLAAPSAAGDQRARANELLDRLGLADRQRHRPAELSAGERQRVALARAMLNRPKLILADEPTGNLDPDNAAAVIGHLAQYRRDGGTVIVVTHGTVADPHATRLLHLRAGRVEG